MVSMFRGIYYILQRLKLVGGKRHWKAIVAPTQLMHSEEKFLEFHIVGLDQGLIQY